jgi:membrane-bound serine protease (ClpP class)
MYVLMNVPGFFVSAGILFGAYELGWLSGRVALAVLGIFVLKDAILYPFVREALRSDRVSLVGPEQLVGEWAVVEDALDPRGTVRVKGERWRGECVGAAALAGQRVRIVAVRGLTLLVSSDAEKPAAR